MFPVICLIGYCMVPLNICAFVLAVGEFHFVVKLLFVGIACGWSVYSSVGFMKNAIEQEKMLLLVYPVVLEFLFLSAVVYMNKQ